jgi:hypothetical protein
MKDKPPPLDLDAYSTVALHELLTEVMVKLRERDAKDLKQNFVTKSQRVTLQEKIERHLKGD